MLCLIINKNCEQKLVFPLVQNYITIGSHSDNDIQLDDSSRTVSRFHAVLLKDQKDNYHLQDLGSKNGTLVNGKTTRCQVIQLGDKISISEEFFLTFQNVNQVKGVKKKAKPVRILYEKGDILKTDSTHISHSLPQHYDVSRLEKFPKKLSLLYRLSHKLHGEMSVEDSLQDILENLMEFTGAERGFVASGSKVEELDFIAKVPMETGTIKNRSLIKHVLFKGDILFTVDAMLDTRFRDVKSILEIGIRSAVGTPLKSKYGITGILYLDSLTKPSLFNEDEDLEFLHFLSRDIALAIEKEKTEELVRTQTYKNEIVGISKHTRKLKKEIEKFAPYPSSVIVTGETGVGKELVAKAIHKASKRKGHFVGINITAIPNTLVESEFFGYEKGAHATAFKRKMGLFELAEGGTLFLDEIGDTSFDIQTKLLRAIQEKEIWKLGSTTPTKIDVRIVTATNRNFLEEIERGRFRHDLYQRLSVLKIHVLPLKERSSDIPLLTGYFIHEFREEFKKEIAGIKREALELLVAYHWPGNIRELRNVIERAVIESKFVITPRIIKRILPEPIYALNSLKAVEEEHIAKVLKHTNGNKERAIHILDISKQTLYNKGREYKLAGFEKS